MHIRYGLIKTINRLDDDSMITFYIYNNDKTLPIALYFRLVYVH